VNTPENETALATQEPGGELAAFDALAAFEALEGQGLENITSNDKAIPRLYLLQKGTPAADEDSDGYVQGAKVGMLWNSLTNMLYDARNGVRILPVFMHKEYVERDPDKNTFVATHPLNTPVLADCTPKRTARRTKRACRFATTTATRWSKRRITSSWCLARTARQPGESSPWRRAR
jgi:hypothetical protein